MRPAAVLSSLVPFSFSAARGRKLLALLLCACLFVNCMVPRFILGHESAFTMLAIVMEKQSELVQLSLIRSLAMKLMSALMEWSTHQPCPVSSQKDRGDSSKSGDTSNEYSLSGYVQRSDDQYWLRTEAAAAGGGTIVEEFLRCDIVYRIGQQCEGVRALLLLLLLFITFGRRGISGEAVVCVISSLEKGITGFGLSKDKSDPVFIYIESESDTDQKRIRTRRQL